MAPFVAIVKTEIVETGDLTTIAAVLSAPAYLSGLTEKQHDLIRTFAAQTLAPEQTAQRAEAVEALGRVTKANDHFMERIGNQLREWRDDDAKIIQEALS